MQYDGQGRFPYLHTGDQKSFCRNVENFSLPVGEEERVKGLVRKCIFFSKMQTERRVFLMLIPSGICEESFIKFWEER